MKAVDELIIKTVAKECGLVNGAIYSRCRKREIVEARQQAITLLMEVGSNTLAGAASPFDQDHATALHGKRTVKNLCDTDLQYRERYYRIRKVVVRVVDDFLERDRKSPLIPHYYHELMS